METTIFKLQPVNNRKSFYGKCKVIKQANVYKLLSYNTIVAEFDGKILKINGRYSATTATHINSFLQYFGYPTATKKEMENRPTEGKTI